MIVQRMHKRWSKWTIKITNQPVLHTMG